MCLHLRMHHAAYYGLLYEMLVGKALHSASVAFRVLSRYSLPLVCLEDGMFRRTLSIAITGPEGCGPRHVHNGQMRRKGSRAVSV